MVDLVEKGWWGEVAHVMEAVENRGARDKTIFFQVMILAETHLFQPDLPVNTRGFGGTF